MAAIITNKFRINNAEQFVESFSETAAETYYLFIGRAHAWASDADVQGNTIADWNTLRFTGTLNSNVDGETMRLSDINGNKSSQNHRINFAFPTEVTKSA